MEVTDYIQFLTGKWHNDHSPGWRFIRAIIDEKVAILKEAGISGVYALGNTSEPVCQIAVGLNRVGMVLLGGLIDYQQLISFRQL